MLQTDDSSSLPSTRKAGCTAVTEHSAQSLARAIFQQLKSSGCQDRDVIAISSQLIALVTSALAQQPSNSR